MAYIYQYTVNGALWYIGKGNNGRDRMHLTVAQRSRSNPRGSGICPWHHELLAAMDRGEEIEITRLHDDLTEEEATRLEVALIRKLKPAKNSHRNPDVTRQATRLLKLQCPACGYILRGTRKWIDVGLPTCCCGTRMEVVDDRSQRGT